MSCTNAEFTRAVLAYVVPDAPFEPSAHYDPDGDCIEVITSPEPFYAERVSDTLTVYYGQESGEVVGSFVQDVSRMLRATGG